MQRNTAPEAYAPSPLDDGARLGEPTTEDHHQDEVALLEAAAAVRLIERNRNRSGRGVAVAVHINEEAVERDLQPVGDGFDDADACVVRNNACDSSIVSPASWRISETQPSSK